MGGSSLIQRDDKAAIDDSTANPSVMAGGKSYSPFKSALR